MVLRVVLILTIFVQKDILYRFSRIYDILLIYLERFLPPLMARNALVLMTVRYKEAFMLFRYIFIVLLSLVLVSCGDSSGDIDTEDNSLSQDDSESYILEAVTPGSADAPSDGAGYDEKVKNILFAHGYHDDEYAWDSFAKYIEDNETLNSKWEVYRTSVPKKESIETRGEWLADYISRRDEVEDDSLIVVGHSMGGLDLRYIITMGHDNEGDQGNEYYKAAKKIHKVYTIASPHRGNMSGGSYPLDPGAISLGIEQMRDFNIKHPYHNFNIDKRDIPMLAFRYHCADKISSYGEGAIEPSGIKDDVGDGTVALTRQILFGAPFTQTVFHGRHTSDLPNPCFGADLELETPEPVLKGILNNTEYYTDIKDIIFYENDDCTGDEKGMFSSRYKPGVVDCSNSDKCDSDEFKSLKLYPSIKPNTAIKIYDSSSRSTSDDWTRIHVGQSLSKPFCVSGFEHDTLQSEAEKGITVVHHHRNGLNGKVSSVNIFSSHRASDPLDIIFYENDDCTGDIIGAFKSDDKDGYDVNCKESDRCKNDEARSLLIYPSANKAADIYIYNDSGGDKDYAWAHINLTDSEFSEPYCLKGFDKSFTDSDTDIEITSHEQKKFGVNKDLTGHVSRIEIRP